MQDITELLDDVHGGTTGYVAGDSIALGVAQTLHWQHNARVGAPSSEIVNKVPNAHGHYFMVISAGSNDPRNPHLFQNLETMRKRAGGGVLWIAPVDPHARSVVQKVAAEHGDHVVTFTPGKDHVHPRSYSELAHKIQQYNH
ncbi:MAG: hypothetical protein QM831_43180 [Kofleriaceae bacterium]